jgi:hypothetical protein
MMANPEVIQGTDVAGSSDMKDGRRIKIAGLSLIVSPVLWFIGAVLFRPQLGGFYDEGDSLTKLSALTGEQTAWTFQSFIFFAGTMATVVGLWLLASFLQKTRTAQLARYGKVGIAAVAALITVILFLRLAAPTNGAVTANSAPLMMAAHFGWLGTVFTSLTVLTVALYGAVLFWSKQAKISGALVSVLSILVFVATLSGGPLPPVIIYPIVAILGVRMLFWKPSPK